MSYWYRGRHRKPTHTGRSLALLATTGALAFGGVALTSGTASAATPLDAIAECESGGSYTAQNPNSTASGKYQFLDSTWRAMGGSTARAKDASPAEQERLALKLYEQQGTTPWNASKSCWGGKVTVAQPKSKSKAQPKTEPKAKAPAKPKPPVAKSGRHHVVEPGDTLSGIASEAGFGRNWIKLYEMNRAVVGDNPNLILPGQNLEL